MARKRKKAKNKGISYLKYINIAIAFIIILAFSFSIYNFLQEKKHSSNQKPIQIKPKKIDDKPKFEEITKSLEVEYIDEDEEEQEVVIKSNEINKQNQIFSKNDIEDIEKKTDKKNQIQAIKKSQFKPKLIIIIDDVSNKKQVKAIQSIGYPITISFFPPEIGRPNSYKAAIGVKNYMIHLPCEANSLAFDEPKTLHTTDPYYVYDERIAEVKKLFPNAKFINNHTGSKLTADRKSMDKLMRALKKYDFSFIDSLTTNKSVAKIYAKKYGVKYFRRNVFIDNKQEVDYILNKIKKAIKIAKKRGLAIAIGHPHKQTFIALKKAKKFFKNIELVYVDFLLNYKRN